MENNRGFISVQVLFILLILSMLSTGIIILAGILLNYESRSNKRWNTKVLIEETAVKVLKLIIEDSTPESDSKIDRIWEEIESLKTDDITIELKDVSSCLNPNWIRKNLFAKTNLDSLFTGGRSADELQQYREDNGFFTDIYTGYKEFFDEQTMNKYFSPYSYANLNISDEFALKQLYTLRTGNSSGAEAFHTKVQDLLINKKLLKKDELENFLMSDYSLLYPVINVEPPLNIHYVDTYILEELLSYPDFNVKEPENCLDILISLRDNQELTSEDLISIIQIKEPEDEEDESETESRIFQYIGVKTWFWQITVIKGNYKLILIAARLPVYEEGEAGKYTIIEKRFTL